MFEFKQFKIEDDKCAMKVGTDGVLLGAWADGGQHILDIGTGTGLIAIMMAQRFPEASVTAIDIDGDAAAQAKENTAQSPFHDRISTLHSCLQEFPLQTFDAITCNPPFFEGSMKCPEGSRTTARHTDSLPYSTLFECCARLLADNGTLSIIIPTGLLSRIEAECAFASLFISKRLHIKTTERKQPKRTMISITKHPTPTSNDTAILMEDGKRSRWYTELTRDFYLDR